MDRSKNEDRISREDKKERQYKRVEKVEKGIEKSIENRGKETEVRLE
jgi:hypothetical protein